MNAIFTSIQNLERDLNGVASHTSDLKKSLELRGHRVSFITPYEEISGLTPFYSRTRRLFYRFYRRTGFSFVYLLFLLSMGLELYKKLIKNINRYDIINAHDVISAWVSIRASNGKVPVVLTCHFWSEPWKEFTDAGFLREGTFCHKILFLTFKKILKNDKLYFSCVSKNNLRLLQRVNPDAVKRAKVIYLGVKPLPKKNIEYLLLSETDFVINVGCLEQRKNQRILIEVARELKKLKKKYMFVLVGPENDSEKEYFEKELLKNSIHDYFSFLGPQDRATVFSLMRKAMLYFHTSKEESFGMTLIESISVGTPVVAMEYEALSEILDGLSKSRIGPDSSPREIALNLIKLLENKQSLSRLLFDEQKIFQERFTLDRMSDEFELFYKSLIKDEFLGE